MRMQVIAQRNTASEQAQVVTINLQHGLHGPDVGEDALCEGCPNFFFSWGQDVAFGDNFGYGAWKAAYDPAQIDTQAVVCFWVSSTTVFFFWNWARNGRYKE